MSEDTRYLHQRQIVASLNMWSKLIRLIAAQVRLADTQEA
jgi:hypothetical protein